ncbi:hypothetical protein [Rhizosphaericola mali]|uniref:DUF4890 domain-containing protein n=1 Tax=Rhizosphaericola mali TaxID=2545455 RepID=A0A5P2G0C4_9BACT|nr:hypothetical protein [Rhizosphaericola mali]QES88098.1 hypothetical protein E0W69_005265 [Rhizosphaericola mali]
MHKIRILVLGVLFLTTSAVLHAQTDSTAKVMTDNLNSKVQFSKDQYNQVLQANQDFLTAMQKLRTDEGSRLSKFKSLKSLDENRDAKMKQILSDDQYKLYLKNKEDKRKQMKSLKDSK